MWQLVKRIWRSAVPTDSNNRADDLELVVAGGAGRVGLPLSVLLAERHPAVVRLFDIDKAAMASIRSGRAPFAEAGLPSRLTAVLSRNLRVSEELPPLDRRHVILVAIPGISFDGGTGSPLRRFCLEHRENLRQAGGVIFVSTLAPGQFDELAALLGDSSSGPPIAYCPERFAEGAALSEMTALPQIISGRSATDLALARRVFAPIADELLDATVREAEMAKLLTNAWRYVWFAASNQMFALCTEAGVDPVAVERLMRHRYPRLSSMPSAGLAGGPCLPNDTRILVESGLSFPMGQAAQRIHREFPEVLVRQLARQMPLSGRRVAVLGLTFKADSDDSRGALSGLVVETLVQAGAQPLPTDEYSVGKDVWPLAEALRQAEGVIVAVPHKAYRGLRISVPRVDPWGVTVSGSAAP